MKLQWMGKNMIHSLCIQEQIERIETSLEGNTLEMIFLLPDEIAKLEETMELSIYLDQSDENQIFINGTKATSFHLNDKMSIESYERKIEMKISLVEGEGKFWGHIMRHNRPAQTVQSQTECFDWKIALRTISRSERAKLKLTLSY